MKKKLLALALSAVLAATMFVGCGGGSGSADNNGGGSAPAGSAEGWTLTAAISLDIAGFDPALNYDPDTSVVANQVVETLVTYDQNDQLIPWIASGFTTDDNKTFVYTIRDDVTFSDGTPLTVDDVVFSLKRIADPQGGALMQWMLEGVESIEKTGDNQVTIVLAEPTNNWPHVLATPAGSVVSKAYYEQHPDDFGTATGGILATGAYTFDTWTSGQEIILKKNANYWAEDLTGAPETIVFKIIPDDTTRVAALKTGEVDLSTRPPLELYDQLATDPNLIANNFPSYGVTFIALNTQRAPLNDVNVRKAINHALDLESFATNIIGNSGSLASTLPQSSALYGPLPQEWEAYAQSAQTYEYNLDKAREYLAKSAYPDGFTATIVTNESTRYNDISLFVQESLAPLGIQVEIAKVSSAEHDDYYWGTTRDADGHRDYDFLVGSWWADFPDIGGNIEGLYLEGPTDTADYNNPIVTDLLKKEITELDPAARNQLIFDALDIIIDEAPYVFVQYPNSQTVINKRITGVRLDTDTARAHVKLKTARQAG